MQNFASKLYNHDHVREHKWRSAITPILLGEQYKQISLNVPHGKCSRFDMRKKLQQFQITTQKR